MFILLFKDIYTLFFVLFIIPFFFFLNELSINDNQKLSSTHQ